MATTSNHTEKYNESKKFMDALNTLLGIVDDVAKSMTDEQYLTASNSLKTLYDNRTTIKNTIINTTVVQEHERRVRRNLPPRQHMTTEEKILAGQPHLQCAKCDRIIFGKHEEGHFSQNMLAHMERPICHDIYASKKLSGKVGSHNTKKYLIIISAIRKWAVKNRKYKYYM